MKLLEDNGYAGSRHFDAHAYRTEDYDGVKDFPGGCMRMYLILKDTAAKWNADPEIKTVISEINSDDGSMRQCFGKYSSEKSDSLRTQPFDRVAIADRGLK